MTKDSAKIRIFVPDNQIIEILYVENEIFCSPGVGQQMPYSRRISF